MKLKLKVYPYLEIVFGSISNWAEKQRQRFAICPDCGRNRYKGKPCK